MKSLAELTDEHALAVANIIGSHYSDEGKISDAKQLFGTAMLFHQQTNISGIKWYRAFEYLKSQGYTIE